VSHRLSPDPSTYLALINQFPTLRTGGFASLLINAEGGLLTALLPSGPSEGQVQVWLLVGPGRTRRLGEAMIGTDQSAVLAFDPGSDLLADLGGSVTLRLQAAEDILAQGVLCPLPCGSQAEVHARLRPTGLASRTASGTAVLQAKDATLTMELRGLPAPRSLGRAKSDGAPFEMYQVWTGQTKSGRKELLGELAQRQGSHWSFHQSGAQAALRADMIMVVPASRTGMRKTGPPLLVGSLPSLEITDSV
jgi:hypothetical protein